MGNAAAAKQTARRGRPPVRRPAQHAALLDAAAEQVNQSGAASISLADLGARIGVTRSGMYYYCADAADLVFQCYVRACTRLQEDIEAASTLSVGADEKLASFIRAVLASDRPAMAVLNDVAFLPEAPQADIAQRAEAHVQKLSAILESGQKEALFRDIDTDCAARLILNCLSWTLVSKPWLARRDDLRARDRYADTVIAMLLDGLAPGPLLPHPCDIRFDRLMSKTINAFDRQQTAEQKADQIIAAASRLFNAKGLDGVTLDDVSSAIGASKGAVYHHFRDKSDLVERCYERGFDIYDIIMETGVSTGATPLEKAVIVIHLNAQAQLSATPPLSLQPGLSKMPVAKGRALSRRAQALNSISTRNLTEGARDGTCRKLDMVVAPEITAGYFLGLHRHVPATANPVEAADFVVDLVINGLRSRASPN